MKHFPCGCSAVVERGFERDGSLAFGRPVVLQFTPGCVEMRRACVAARPSVEMVREHFSQQIRELWRVGQQEDTTRPSGPLAGEEASR